MPGQVHADEPADGVLRLAIANPGKRGALDHAILDALAEAVQGAPARGARALLLAPVSRLAEVAAAWQQDIER